MDTTSVLGTSNNLCMPGLGPSRQLVAELDQSTLKNFQLYSSEIDMHESNEVVIETELDGVRIKSNLKDGYLLFHR